MRQKIGLIGLLVALVCFLISELTDPISVSPSTRQVNSILDHGARILVYFWFISGCTVLLSMVLNRNWPWARFFTLGSIILLVVIAPLASDGSDVDQHWYQELAIVTMLIGFTAIAFSDMYYQKTSPPESN